MNTKSTLALLSLVLFAAPAAVDDSRPKAIDGSTTLACGTSTMLFGGAVPPHGFMIQVINGSLAINDNGPASGSPPQGFYIATQAPPFITPPNYTPMGPVSVFALCGGPTVYVIARAW